MRPVTGVSETPVAPPLPRVREQVRDGLRLMAFSATVSVAAAGVLALLTRTWG